MAKIGWRVWILIIVLLFSLIAIKPSFKEGALIKSVDKNSSLFEEGLRSGNIIIGLNGEKVASKEDYGRIVEEIFNDGLEKRLDIQTEDNEYTVLINLTPNIHVDDVPRTRIKTGLDLRGGSRALVQPETPLTDAEMDDLLAVSSNRLNVFGLSDVQLKKVSDLSGNRFMLVEVAGSSPAELQDLIAKQGKFEAKVGNESVFLGGKEDIADVCRNDATCAGIVQCSAVQTGGYGCEFRFTLYLTENAAKKHADVTSNVPLDETGQYLSEKLYLYVDNQEVDSLLIGASLKGQVTTQISIQGSGTGNTQEDALRDAKESMHKLQTVLITGSLPYKLNIVKLDTISPVLGDKFVKNLLLAGVAALIAVSIIIFIRYRKFKASLALLLTSFSEIIIILGVASLIGWNLDLPSIAGILATIGTGVDSQIVILDEARRNLTSGIKEKIKRALFIIMSSYATSMASLIPLYWAGAGLFKGFAITTIIGITAGVFISRPAFAEIIRKMEE
ncbi:MAG: preprotein translocase subunit SecD [Nanoarchaeota archaeon]